MTIEDKKKCAEVFETLTGKKTNPESWNKNAGDLLAEMVARLIYCSDAMDFVPRPAGFKPGWGYIVKYVYGVINRTSGQVHIYDYCLVGVGPVKRQLEMALTLGE